MAYSLRKIGQSLNNFPVKHKIFQDISLTRVFFDWKIGLFIMCCHLPCSHLTSKPRPHARTTVTHSQLRSDTALKFKFLFINLSYTEEIRDTKKKVRKKNSNHSTTNGRMFPWICPHMLIMQTTTHGRNKTCDLL